MQEILGQMPSYPNGVNGTFELAIELPNSEDVAAREFYEGILGFEPGPFYEPTSWQPYNCQREVFFAIGMPPGPPDEISFVITNIESLWSRAKDRVDIAHPLELTAWGTYRFVIRDPDGHLLAFGQKRN